MMLTSLGYYYIITVEIGSASLPNRYNLIFGKLRESVGRKALGPVKWQPVANKITYCGL
jgi:hypothetical protein